MLSITRKVGEKIIIRPAGSEPVVLHPGEQLEVHVSRLGDKNVRLAIAAKDELRIVRGELLLREAEEAKQAASGQ